MSNRVINKINESYVIIPSLVFIFAFMIPFSVFYFNNIRPIYLIVEYAGITSILFGGISVYLRMIP